MSREAYPEPAPRAKPGTHGLSTAAERILIAVMAVLLLVPCFWQPHMMAGDLSSHIYNAWLVGQIKQGKMPTESLSLAHPFTQVLGDWASEQLLYFVGPSSTERIMAGAAVEIFFWGAYFFVATVAGQRCWVVTPSLAMIAYGLIFHAGFFNFYLATGMCLWMMALLWRPRRPWIWLAIPLAVLALLAHPLPLAWAVAALLYVHAVRRVPEPQRFVVFIGGASLLVLVQSAVLALLPTGWSLGSLVNLEGSLGLTGAAQLWLFGGKYLIVVAGILIVWFLLFLERLDRGGILADPAAHIWGLSMVAYILLPATIQFPQYRFPLLYMPLRVSLFIAILFCAMVAGGPHGRSLTRVSGLLAAVFFTSLYLDKRSLNQVEAEVAGLVSNLPPGQRVIADLRDSGSLRLNGLSHISSTVCLGHCWDYGNYEPSTGQFRIRVSGPNPVVVDNMRIVSQIEASEHIVTPQEAPLYTICPPKESAALFELRKLGAGETTCVVTLQATNQF